MKAIAALFTVLALISGPVNLAYSQNLDVTQNKMHMLESSVWIQNGDGVCGGTYFTSQKLITAAHCVNGVAPDGRVIVHTYQGSSLMGVVERRNVELDLAIVVTTNRPDGQPYIQLGDSVNVFDEVWGIGAPLGEPFIVSHGYISKIVIDSFENCDKNDKGGTGQQQILTIDIMAFGGDSGGGVFDANGRLVGVWVRQIQVGWTCENQNGVAVPLWGFAVGIDTVKGFLGQEANQ